MESLIITPEDGRLTTYPLARPNVFKWYEDAVASFWSPGELSLTTDADHYMTKLTADERHFIKFVLAFFAASDGIVNVNLAERFKKDIPILEVGYFYDFQIVMESIHAHTYSILLEGIILSAAECNHLFNAFKTIPVIENMTKYMFATIDSSALLSTRLIRMACVEGIFFTGCFCVIYWFQNRSLMPVLGHTNELIARDEALHTTFALFLYDMLPAKLTWQEIHKIVDEAVILAKAFIAEAIPRGFSGMNAGLMGTYVENRADDMLDLLGYKKLYNSPKSEFSFNDQISMLNRTNFFERRVSDYHHGGETHDNGEFHEDF